MNIQVVGNSICARILHPLPKWVNMHERRGLPCGGKYEMEIWSSLFTFSTDPYHAYVTSCDDAVDIIEEFAYATHTNYVITRATGGFGHCELNAVVIGDHSYLQDASKKKVVGTKKKNCPAAIYLRELLVFPDYKIEENSTKHIRKKISKLLRDDLASPMKTVGVQKYISISLPREETHLGHIMGEAADLKAPIHQKVLDFVNKFVHDGVQNAGEMKRHVRSMVKTMFDESHTLPNFLNRRFYPSREDLRKLIYRQKRKIIHGLLDQELLAQKITQWQAEKPEDHWFFRPSTEIETNDEEGQQPFLLVYQSQWQQELLLRYGQELCFLDATYKTTRYAIPLFFLVVRTNSGYCVVATLILEKEDSKSLGEGLSILRQWNSTWTPKGFMIDYSELEINALNMIFQGIDTLICDFHRKQAWLRWTSATKNGVTNDQTEILKLLNSVAESFTEEDLARNLTTLKTSVYWRQHPRLANYIDKQWLGHDIYKKWVWAYRGSYAIVVNTNNGVESQNKVFKHEYLSKQRANSVSAVMLSLVEDFFQDAHRRYLTSNVTMSSGWRKPNQNIPVGMYHRPAFLIKHMRDAFLKAANSNTEKPWQIDFKQDNIYIVYSSSRQYVVDIGSEDQVAPRNPSCQCWDYRHTHLPCKHIAAVICRYSLSWDSFPKQYRDNPLFVIDDKCTTLPPPSQDEAASVASGDENVETTSNIPSSNSNIHVLARRTRELLDQIKDATYLTTSSSDLQAAVVNLESVYSRLQAGCSRSGGLLLDVERKTKPTGKRNIKPLPKRRKRKGAKGQQSAVLGGENSITGKLVVKKRKQNCKAIQDLTMTKEEFSDELEPPVCQVDITEGST